MTKLRKRIFEIIQIGNRTDIPSTIFDIFIAIVIVTSIVATLLLTYDGMAPYKKLLDAIELVTIIIFIIEYVLRLITADQLYPKKKRPVAVVSFIFSFYGIIYLLTIASYFIPVLFSIGVVAFRMLRVVRIMRLFNLTSGYDAFNVIFDVLKSKKNQILSSVVMIFILMLMSSVCMYSVEHTAQPEVFANAFSGLWWSVSTVLTVGYGDIYPITTAGRIFAIVIAFLGVGLVAIPTGIISAGFVEHYSKVKNLEDNNPDNDFVQIIVDKKIRLEELEIIPGMIPIAVFRGEELIKPQAVMELAVGDKVLIGKK